MSVIGKDPNRDKMAKVIIYGGWAAYFYLLKLLALANISNPVAVYKIWFQSSKERKEVKDKAWKNYCETGDILKSLGKVITCSFGK